MNEFIVDDADIDVDDDDDDDDDENNDNEDDIMKFILLHNINNH
jgi:hypothetical protein